MGPGKDLLVGKIKPGNHTVQGVFDPSIKLLRNLSDETYAGRGGIGGETFIKKVIGGMSLHGFHVNRYASRGRRNTPQYYLNKHQTNWKEKESPKSKRRGTGCK